jgi:rRNA small subunit pseudouridine methyltransferase Nep1
LVLTLVLAESAIELVPNEITGLSTVRRSAEEKRKDPHELILDQSYHHSAILRLEKRGVGRGRPDIAHFSLLLALGSPLNADGELRCFVHTRDDHIITVNPQARLPRNTDRFTSLLEQLYKQKVVPSIGAPLLSLKKQSLSKLLSEITSDLVVALTTEGTPKSMEMVAAEMRGARTPVVLVGGFPSGHFSRRPMDLSSRKYRIDKRPLDAWTVVGRTIYDYEKTIGLKRF